MTALSQVMRHHRSGALRVLATTGAKRSPLAPEVVERLQALGLEPAGSTPDELAARVADDKARWAPVVKASGFVVEPIGMAAPKGRDAAAARDLTAFVEQAKRDGLVARAIERAGLRGVNVAPPTSPRAVAASPRQVMQRLAALVARP